MQSKIDISFANKKHDTLSSRMTRNQARIQNESDFVDLDQADDPTSFAAHAMLDLKDRSHPTSPAPSERVRTEIDDEIEIEDCEHVVCQDCLDYKSQILNLKDDISELHKEILKLRRQKRLINESYELEIVELNKKIKNNEPEQRFNSSGINIIINSEGQSSKSKEN